MKKKMCVLALVTTVVLTGCSSDVPDLSKVDNNLAAQYMADRLLQKDKHYDEGLDYDHSVLQATPTPAPTVVPATSAPQTNGGSGSTAGENASTTGGEGASLSNGGSNGENSQENLQSVSLSDIYGVSGITIKGSAYRVVSSYGTDYAVCTAKKGYKLVAVNFSISNNTKSAKKVNLQKQKMQAELLVNGKSMGSPLLSIVDGDLQYFNAEIAAGKKKQGVLIFEINKNVKVSDVKVRFTKGSQEAVVTMH